MGITVSERFIQQTKNISRSFADQQLIARDMIRMMRRTLKKLQTIYVKNLLYGLMERNMGTPDVINHTGRMLRTRNGATNHRRDRYGTRNNTLNTPEPGTRRRNDTGMLRRGYDAARPERYDGRRRRQQGSRQSEIVTLAMKSKVKDAWENIREQKRIEQQMWRRLRPKLRDKEERKRV